MMWLLFTDSIVLKLNVHKLCLSISNSNHLYHLLTGRLRNHGHYVCSTWGNSHFKTFDGDYYQFQGKCSYNLASDCRDAYKEFSVHVHRSSDSDHPFINKLTVTIKDVVILLQKAFVVVNGDA